MRRPTDAPGVLSDVRVARGWLLAALWVGVAACGDDGAAGSASDSAGSSSSTTADLLSSREALSPSTTGPGADASDAPTGSLPPGRPLARPEGASRPEASSRPAQSRPPSPPPSPSTEGAGGATLDLDALGHTTGEADAPVKVVEFSDFGCGYCRKFHMETFPSLEEEYIETGKVQWKYVPMILGMFGPNAETAAQVGECALEQDRFPAMRDRLFEDQSEWKRSSDPMPVFQRFAREEGLDVERWEQCVREGRRQERVEFGTRLSRQVGVRGTPTFFVIGYAPIPGAIPLDIFRQVLDTVYVQAQRRGRQAEGGR